MSNPKNHASPQDPDNPYNIDFAREHRLKRIFQWTIGIGFVLSAVLIAAAFALDFMLAGREENVGPATPYSTPAAPAKQPVNAP
jgi:hypothetical protein